MSETLPVGDVQAWFDDSTISCGDCGSESLAVEDTLYSSMMEDAFDDVSPHRVELKCEDCGNVTRNSLRVYAVEEITG